MVRGGGVRAGERTTGARCPRAPACAGHEDHREKTPVLPEGKDHRGKMPGGRGRCRR